MMFDDEAEYIKKMSKMIDTPTPCSCFMYGNPRKYWKEESRQEIIAKRIFQEQTLRI